MQEYMTMSHFEWAVVAIFVALWTILLVTERLPELRSIKELMWALNSRGGNIFVLTALSMFFFAQAIRMFYVMIDLVSRKAITPENAYALMGLQFVTSSAFGGAFGALLKTMTGESSTGNRVTDNKTAPPNGAAVTQSNRAATPPPPETPAV